MIEREELLRYFQEYPDAFTELEQKYILVYKNRRNTYLPDLIREIQYEFHVIKEEDNLFRGFLDLIEEKFPLRGRTVMDVGGGILPQLAKEMVATTDVGKIVVCDPRLSVYEKDTERMKLVRDFFGRQTDVSHVDLMVGLTPPCGVVEDMVAIASENNIDFMIAMSENGFFDDFRYDFYDSLDEAFHAIIYTAKHSVLDHDMGTLKVASLSKYRFPYPVIYNERKTK